MVLFPNCKINLGLHVTSKRPDGYHNIETVFFPVGWNDVLEIIAQPNPSGPHPQSSAIAFTNSGLSVPGNTGNNLCVKAYNLLKRDFPDLPSIFLHLHKTIPIGAGLGGGSSNGAFTLILLNRKFQLNLSEEQLLHYAFQLGSDCPFFINNTPCFATGRGEKTETISLDLSDYSFLIVYPAIPIQTAWAFSQVAPAGLSSDIKVIIQQPVETWKNTLRNDFELPVFSNYPQIKKVKDILYNQGALYASLSGSGSAVFGIFSKNKIPHLQWDKDYTYKIIL